MRSHVSWHRSRASSALPKRRERWRSSSGWEASKRVGHVGWARGISADIGICKRLQTVFDLAEVKSQMRIS